MSLNIKNLQTYQAGRGTAKTNFTDRGIRKINAGSRVDAIVINGDLFGGDGGTPARKEDLVLNKDEFISRMVITHGEEVNSIEITTNEGRSLKGGDDEKGGGHKTTLTGTIVALGGNFGDRLDRLNVLGEMNVHNEEH
ncbi:MAG: hypothetical protein P8P74_13395 [Crocinitomicaceae bacterium]|nr:hypothetical protein [Crocinitomicaceae bacterium]